MMITVEVDTAGRGGELSEGTGKEVTVITWLTDGRDGDDTPKLALGELPVPLRASRFYVAAHKQLRRRPSCVSDSNLQKTAAS